MKTTRISLMFSENHNLINSRIDQLNVLTFTLGLLIPIHVDSRLTVFTNSRTVYPKILFTRKAGRDQPSPSDPALLSPMARYSICEDLSRSGVFAALEMNALNIPEMYQELQQPRYCYLFARIFEEGERRGQEVRYFYLNPYRLLEIETYEHSDTGQRIRIVWKTEYFFFCVLKIGSADDGKHQARNNAIKNGSDEIVDVVDEDEVDSEAYEENLGDNVQRSDSEETVSGYRRDESGRSDSEETVSEYRMGESSHQSDSEETISEYRTGEGTDTEEGSSTDEDESMNLDVGDVVTLYVSKLYNAHQGLHAFRFVLVEVKSMADTFAAVMLAAESARVYLRPDFNVELHYIELRKHRRPAQNCREDPVCKLILKKPKEHQLFQLCTKVLTSSYFADHVQYPSRTPSRLPRNFWFTERVFFRTQQGLKEAAGKIYKEYVLPCYADTTGGAGQVLYISRGHNPYQVFLFTNDPVNDQLYVENLIIDIRFLADTVTFFLLILSVDGKYTVITNFNTMYPKGLYVRAGNSDQPSLLLDPATFDVATRRRLCEEISQSGVFTVYGMHPVDMDEVYEDLQHSSIFHLIYGVRTFRNQQYHYEYTNRYRRREMEIGRPTRAGSGLRVVRRHEHLFLCLIKIEDFAESEETDTRDTDDGEDVDEGNSNEVIQRRHSDGEQPPTTEDTDEVILVPFSVSKLYDAHRGLHAYRFLFLDLEKRNNNVSRDVVVMLAAESAHAYVRPDFNVELHYVELRKHHHSVRNCKYDPVCKLKFEKLHNERLFHLCTSILTSSHFADRVQYPSRISFRTTQDFWYTEQIFFRTKEGLEKGAGRFYKEFVLPCHADTGDGEEEVFYISRAYNPYHVFVFTKDPVNDQLYLENLFTDVSLVHERYNFGDVEI